MVELLEMAAAITATGANGMIILLAYVAVKHELRIVKLEGYTKA